MKPEPLLEKTELHLSSSAAKQSWQYPYNRNPRPSGRGGGQ
jgi:hypothetical protein